MRAARYIGKGLVNRDPLHEWRVVGDDMDSGITKALVLAEVAAYEGERWAQLPRTPSKHTALDAERLGFVRGGEHHSAADGDWFSAQGGIEHLLDRGIERVEVCMEKRGFHLDAPAGILFTYTVSLSPPERKVPVPPLARQGAALVPAASRDEALRQLLAAGARLRIETTLGGEVCQLREIQLALGDAPAELAVPAAIALLSEPRQLPAAHDIRRRQQSARQRIYAADVRQIQIGGIERLAAQLGVEIEAAGAEAAVLDELRHRRHQLLRVVGELVGVPAIARIAAIHVDGAEDAIGACRGDLVLEVQPCECGVVDFNVDLHFLCQAIALQKGIDGRHIAVVLVFGRLERLGLDQEGAFEADAMLVLHDHGEE